MKATLQAMDAPPPAPETDQTPRPPVRVLLLGNYEHDRQESMQRFGRLLAKELPRYGIATDFIRPEPYLGRLKPSPVGLAKWLGYFDKFLIFPLLLRWKVAALRRAPGGAPLIVHICDHSNAFYEAVSGAPTLVTCHDLLAVRGALGEDTDCPASRFGRLFQQLILRGLRRADFVVCDSAATRDDLLQLAGASMVARSGVVLLAQNHPYRCLSEAEVGPLLASVPEFDPAVPFLLSVGLNLRRKNRAGVLRILARLQEQWPGQVVFAGEPLDPETMELARSLGVAGRVVQVRKPSNAVLEALYSKAFALLYPSKCEGFGWPIIEAQACGCPVVCSDRTSVPEVAGEGALVCPLEDEAAFAEALLSLRDPDVRDRVVACGTKNLERFRLETMLDRYCDFYLRLAAVQDSSAHSRALERS